MAGKESKYQYLLAFLLFSGLACFSLFFLGNYTDIPSDKTPHLLNRKAILLSFIAVFNGIGFLMTYAGKKIGKMHDRFVYNRGRMVLLFALSAVILLTMNYVLLVAAKWLIGMPHPFRLAWIGGKTLVAIWMVELVVVSQLQVIFFHRKTIELYEHASKLEESALHIQYKALQNQLNPHFLFNCLNTLIAEIEYSPSDAVRFTRHLSDVYRYILSYQDQQLVSLRSELDFLHAYIYLYKVRLGNNLAVDCQIPEKDFSARIPPLTLQLLAENVIKHNVFCAGSPVSIHLSVEPTGAYLTVWNERHPKPGVPVSGKGLQNLSVRYRMLCGKDIAVEQTESRFTVKVPLLKP